MVAYTTSTYNTGWMNGDIKLATLSDTDDTDVTGSELVTNGTFDTDTSGWSSYNGAILSVVSGELVVENGITSFGGATQAITTEIGKVYIVAPGNVTSGGSGYGSLYIGTTAGSNNIASAKNLNDGWTFVATTTSTYISLQNNLNTIGSTRSFDNVSVRLAEPDRSVNGNGLQVYGTITKDPVATGADLVAYSGFSVANYLEQPVNTDLPSAATDPYCIMAWTKADSTLSTSQVILTFGEQATGKERALAYTSAGELYAFVNGSNTSGTGATGQNTNTWRHVALVHDGANGLTFYIDGEVYSTDTLTHVTASSPTLRVGISLAGTGPADETSLALLRISATAPTAEQIAKIYEDEKFLFQEGAQATLYGSSDAVTALAHDEVTDLLHVGTSAGRSVFQGLRRVDNTTDAVGVAISAYDDLVVED
jgi:hypothetical protein